MTAVFLHQIMTWVLPTKFMWLQDPVHTSLCQCRCCNCCSAVVKQKRSAEMWWQSAWATWLCSIPARRCCWCSNKVRCAGKTAVTTHHQKRGAWYGLVTLCMAASCASVTPYAACLVHAACPLLACLLHCCCATGFFCCQGCCNTRLQCILSKSACCALLFAC